MTYLMWKRGTGFRVGISSTYTDARTGALPGPSLRMNAEHADATWIVSTHETDAEARSRRDEHFGALRHSRWCRSSPGPALEASNSLVGDQSLIDSVFEPGRHCRRPDGPFALRASALISPHFTAAPTTGGDGSAAASRCPCAATREVPARSTGSALFGCDDGGPASARGDRGSAASARTQGDSAGGATRRSFASFGRLVERVEDIEHALDVSVRFTARLAVQEDLREGSELASRSCPRAPCGGGMVDVY